MTTQLDLMPDCVLPGCRQPVTRIGDACNGCREVFGDMLQHNPEGTPLTAEEIQKRDHDTVRAMVLMRSITGGGCIRHDDDDEEPEVGEPGETKEAECWSCETILNCTWGSIGWECSDCEANEG
ncbi:hypothetical protein [Rhodococcus qingshengii]|uniref:hypothetical protein n=1 Tax=Rhodococcus qingshengii TaxID=334542 RepID=UPI001ADF8CB9|nr:hypothetical protein [Rhodococcus qingshengii]